MVWLREGCQPIVVAHNVGDSSQPAVAFERGKEFAEGRGMLFCEIPFGDTDRSQTALQALVHDMATLDKGCI